MKMTLSFKSDTFTFFLHFFLNEKTTLATLLTVAV